MEMDGWIGKGLLGRLFLRYFSTENRSIIFIEKINRELTFDCHKQGGPSLRGKEWLWI